jgi:nucleoside 2-deoxyribosyltransferase
MLTIVGGVYRERCLRPAWDEIFGSAGRGATAIARLGGQVQLHSHLDEAALQAFTGVDGLTVVGPQIEQVTGFYYQHALATPAILHTADPLPVLEVQGEKVIRYGMLGSTAVVTADYAVYDPQNVRGIESFHNNGSTAKHLALVLNRHEARMLLGCGALDPAQMAPMLAEQEGAEVVVIKMGPQGALVWHEGQVQQVPAFETTRVWKIGSGDQFVANFAYAWMEEGRSPAEAAERASRATAYFCQNRGYPTLAELDAYKPAPVEISDRFRNHHVPKVYLAGPFFTLGQLWVVEQARTALYEMGMEVFSPYHDVGLGSADEVVEQDVQGIVECDLLLAIADGMDPGTVFEVGYARSLGKPVVVYVENESPEAAKMMVGTDCFMRNDFVSALYQTVWVGAKL